MDPGAAYYAHHRGPAVKHAGRTGKEQAPQEWASPV